MARQRARRHSLPEGPLSLTHWIEQARRRRYRGLRRRGLAWLGLRRAGRQAGRQAGRSGEAAQHERSSRPGRAARGGCMAEAAEQASKRAWDECVRAMSLGCLGTGGQAGRQAWRMERSLLRRGAEQGSRQAGRSCSKYLVSCAEGLGTGRVLPAGSRRTATRGCAMRGTSWMDERSKSSGREDRDLRTRRKNYWRDGGIARYARGRFEQGSREISLCTTTERDVVRMDKQMNRCARVSPSSAVLVLEIPVSVSLLYCISSCVCVCVSLSLPLSLSFLPYLSHLWSRRSLLLFFCYFLSLLSLPLFSPVREWVS